MRCMSKGMWDELTADDEPDPCDRTDPHEHLIRFLLPLPSYVPLPDGQLVTHAYPPPGATDALYAFTTTKMHQVHFRDSDGATLGARASSAVIERIQGRSRRASGSTAKPLHIDVRVTVADVITTTSAPDDPPSDWDGSPQNLGPRQDALMRAIHSVRGIVRSVRLTGQPRLVMPTYERLMPLVIWLSAVAPVDEDGIHIPNDGEWVLGGSTLLEHTNISGWEVTDPTELAAINELAAHWGRAITAANPAVRARELMLESQGLFQHEGDYPMAVAVATTAIEVLVTAILSALFWEENWTGASTQGPTDVAAYFTEGQVLALVAQQLVPRLGGSWTSRSCPWQVWASTCRTLRNRIVHGGHEPTRAEVQAAIDSAEKLQTFVFDRLAARATRYPRVTLMMMGQQGLEKRSLWRGQIKKFADEQADQEKPWMENFGVWHDAMIEAANA